MTHLGYELKRPLLYGFVCFLAGVGAGAGLEMTVEVLTHLAVMVMLLIAAMTLITNRRVFWYLVLAVFFLTGLMRYGLSTGSKQDDIRGYLKKGEKTEVYLTGRVISEPVIKDTSFPHVEEFDMQLLHLLSQGVPEKVSGVVRVRRYYFPDIIGPGDVITVQAGTVPLDRAEKGYSRYLRRKGYSAVAYSSTADLVLVHSRALDQGMLARIKFRVKALRTSLMSVFRSALPPRTSSVMESAVLGIRSGLCDSDRELFARTGTMHILAVSGLHTGIFSVMVIFAARMLNLRPGMTLVLVILLLAGFAALTGARPSTLRAALMVVFVMAGAGLNRNTDRWHSLAGSAFLIIFFRPRQITEPGFVLSYAAVISIMLIYNHPVVTRGQRAGGRIKKAVEDIFLCSFAVLVGTMPITVHYFGVFTPLMLITNLLAIPVLIFIVNAGYLALAFSFLPAQAGVLKDLVLRVVHNVISGFFGFLEVGGSVPGGYHELPRAPVWMVFSYLICAAGLWWLINRSSHNRERPALIRLVAGGYGLLMAAFIYANYLVARIPVR